MKSFNLKAAVKERHLWLNKPDNERRLYSSKRQEFDNPESMPPEHQVADVAFCLNSMAVWFAQNGVAEVAGANAASGWKNLHQALLYRIWDARINMRRVEDNPNPGKNAVWAPSFRVGPSILDAIWSGHHDHAHDLGRRYCSWLLDESYYAGSMYIESGLAGYVSQLYRAWQNRSPVPPPPGNPPLARIGSTLNSQRLLLAQ